MSGSPGKRLVLVGGGHAHMTVMSRLDHYTGRGHHVTLISHFPYHYYSGMGPGLLSGIYKREEVRFHVQKMVEDRGGIFVQDTVVQVDPKRRTLFLNSGKQVDYDVASFNVGSHVPARSAPVSDSNVYTAKPVQNLSKARQAILESGKSEKLRLVVVGGGPSALEISGNLWKLVHDNGIRATISLLAGRELLARFSQKLRRLAMDSFKQRDIEVTEGARVGRIDSGCAFLEDGRGYPFDFLFLAWGIKPPTLFEESGLAVGRDGGLLVNNYLQSVASPEVFGGGDCISLQGHHLDKVGVYAVRQNPILYHNLMAALDGGKMKRFETSKVYLLLFNLGDGKAIFSRKGWIWCSRFNFLLTDYIDRRFMRKFQVSGEVLEQSS
ncbi:MAG: FAD-dependent oxidoreductase [Desulfobacteraceae bacterium]